MTKKKPRKKSSMENEIIMAVVILYLLIALSMLAIHHIQPEGQQTVTSSTSPSHEGFSSLPPADQGHPVKREEKPARRESGRP